MLQGMSDFKVWNGKTPYLMPVVAVKVICCAEKLVTEVGTI